jgi:putative transposase
VHTFIADEVLQRRIGQDCAAIFQFFHPRPVLTAPMKRMDFTESQIVKILCETRWTPVNDVARKHNITEATIHAWRGKFGQLGAEDIKRLRHLKTAHASRQKFLAKARL